MTEEAAAAAKLQIMKYTKFVFQFRLVCRPCQELATKTSVVTCVSVTSLENIRGSTIHIDISSNCFISQSYGRPFSNYHDYKNQGSFEITCHPFQIQFFAKVSKSTFKNAERPRRSEPLVVFSNTDVVC